mmetsp:Transcript_102492/g.208663  ORF Transcript_102492/g.208663 Transcript_102492/m.208663 type:complete len:81 (-) Transcript_102492:606-848(-)
MESVQNCLNFRKIILHHFCFFISLFAKIGILFIKGTLLPDKKSNFFEKNSSKLHNKNSNNGTGDLLLVHRLSQRQSTRTL